MGEGGGEFYTDAAGRSKKRGCLLCLRKPLFSSGDGYLTIYYFCKKVNKKLKNR
jgi:hypothetical protein